MIEFGFRLHVSVIIIQLTRLYRTLVFHQIRLLSSMPLLRSFPRYVTVSRLSVSFAAAQWMSTPPRQGEELSFGVDAVVSQYR